MKFPTYEEMVEMAQNVAEKMLDEYEYKGKTLRQWIEIISAFEHGTNLAEVGTDVPDINVGELISRQAAIIQLSHNKIGDDDCDVIIQRDIETIQQLPSAEPDIIYCKDCRKHNKRIGDYVENSDGTYCWIWKGQACPLAEFRGVAQGHEFDYQYCAYAERRDNG